MLMNRYTIAQILALKRERETESSACTPSIPNFKSFGQAQEDCDAVFPTLGDREWKELVLHSLGRTKTIAVGCIIYSKMPRKAGEEEGQGELHEPGFIWLV
jgi:hypothetical protein